MSNVHVESSPGGLATITLCRPERHNAFDDILIAELTRSFEEAGANPAIRSVMLRAKGASFSAGADLEWMKRMASYSPEENRRDALGLATLLATINDCPKPVIASVQGSAFGGGAGLVAACDIAIAADTAFFSFSEARLGLIPAVISPYVVEAIGSRACRRYFLTAERFSAAEAKRIGLVHETVPLAELPAACSHMLDRLAECGPAAQREAKALIRAVSRPAEGVDVTTWTAERIADIRASDEGREGITAFLEKRPAKWTKGVS